jgi:hydrogenase small subunit
MASGRASMIPLDEALRPTWLFGHTVQEGCDRGGYCTMPGFPDKFMLFMDQPQGSLLSSTAVMT